MIGRLHSIIVDCPDAPALASFYAELTGFTVRDSGAAWATLEDAGGLPRLCFQTIDDFRPPRWPDPAHPQQSHLDIDVDDIGVAEPRVLALGATLLRGGGGGKTGFRVYADPAGHPFCLIWGQA
ncbi:catechol 2,3-dioxygenase-like lactoylglutathione lyase family enzyme [Allocatelliglobosispora scoriae]|uniref:Catechol 2,3-dioxygenase-like lactoylglutathione lyase family enzyme n=1 Tax=Allocatelliglobosispora scoriae TaxID=643052 RepID=A0A841BKU7_9ACTN|nr:VOC family protein [Allocatelliglobosispora scoriae]MBB5868265.1 catechol 2,3-dioxygenase-like lactoylglutathione lyase family enzyme [Allocatelliglobosispora scoriae]